MQVKLLLYIKRPHASWTAEFLFYTSAFFFAIFYSSVNSVCFVFFCWKTRFISFFYSLGGKKLPKRALHYYWRLTKFSAADSFTLTDCSLLWGHNMIAVIKIKFDPTIILLRLWCLFFQCKNLNQAKRFGSRYNFILVLTYLFLYLHKFNQIFVVTKNSKKVTKKSM